MRTDQQIEDQFHDIFNRRHERPGDVFMETLKSDGLIVAPGTYNAMGAQIASKIYLKSRKENLPCSFNAVYASGWAISAMLWGYPDMGFGDLSMMALICKYIVKHAYPLPVIVDAETGFGTEVTLERTVEIYDQIGVALAHMEDQDSNKTRRCGNLVGKQCIEPKDMEAKIRSWLMWSKATGTSMRLMARTDALTAVNGGIENAIERGKRYMNVDYQGLRPTVLWADAMYDPKIIERWVTELHKHDPNMILGINYSPNKDWTGYYRKKFNQYPPTYEAIYDNGHGFRVIWHTILQARADMEATWNTFKDMAENGAEALWKLHERQRNHPVGDTQAMSNVVPWQALEQFLGGEDAVERYQKSEGYGADSKNIK